jgi:UDP-N-acetylmuramoyl-tripeptide--D-alanyl-D-alanine ligase
MSDFVFPIILFVLYGLRTIRSVLNHVAWWDIKEYRFDRMWVHLSETHQGKHWILGYFSLLKWVLLVSYILPVTYIPIQILNQILISTYMVEAVLNLFELKIGWKIPPFRIRAGSIVLLTIFVLISCTFISVILPIKLLFIDKAIGITVSIFVFISNFVFSFYKQNILKKAQKKMSRFHTIRVVGITGSYGKTSTKEFITQILSTKFRIVKTLASQNTDIGIAEQILKSDLDTCELFVAEMSAYHPGEIASSCGLFGKKIKVSVITGINEQHQSLFGSIETTMKSKYELVESLSDSGQAIFNGENEKTREMSTWSKDRHIDSIVVNKTHIKDLPDHIHGSHFKENLALAYATAQAFGMSRREILDVIEDIKLPPRTMDVTKIGSVFFVDDTFNANPNAVYAAFDYIKHIPGKKILILQPLIELGGFADSVHRTIGKLASEICDHIILTNNNFNRPFIEGASEIIGGAAKVHVGLLPSKIREGVILFEGKEAEKYIHKLKV